MTIRRGKQTSRVNIDRCSGWDTSFSIRALMSSGHNCSSEKWRINDGLRVNWKIERFLDHTLSWTGYLRDQRLKILRGSWTTSRLSKFSKHWTGSSGMVCVSYAQITLILIHGEASNCVLGLTRWHSIFLHLSMWEVGRDEIQSRSCWVRSAKATYVQCCPFQKFPTRVLGIGGRYSTEDAFALLTLPTWVWFSAFPIFFWRHSNFMMS